MQHVSIPQRAIPARRQWTLEVLVDELRHLHGRGVRITTVDLLAARETAVLGAIQRLVGSIARARELAELPELVARRPTERQQWSAERVIRAILDRHAAGTPLATSRVPSTLRDAAILWCGSWEAAISQAGLDYAALRLQPVARSRATVLRDLRRLAREQPALTRSELRQHPVSRAARHRFGGLDAALAAAEIEGWPLRRRRAPTQPQRARRSVPRIRRMLNVRETFTALRQRHTDGASLKLADIRREDLALANAILRHYGTLNRALAALALPTRRLRWTRRRVGEALRRRDHEGKALRSETVRLEEPALHRAAQRLFGSFGRALAAVIPGAAPEPLDAPRKTLAALRARYARGESLRRADAPLRLQVAVSHYFGTWQRGLVRAELPVNEILRRRSWTDAQLLAELRALAVKQPELTVTALHRSALGSAAVTRFGSLAKALARAELVDWPRRVRRRLPSRDEVIVALRDRAQRGESMRLALVNRDDGRMAKAALKLFGTWRAALTAAALGDQIWERPLPAATILESLRERYTRGQSLRARDLAKEDHRLYAAAINTYGSLLRALVAAAQPALQPVGAPRRARRKGAQPAEQTASPGLHPGEVEGA